MGYFDTRVGGMKIGLTTQLFHTDRKNGDIICGEKPSDVRAAILFFQAQAKLILVLLCRSL